MYTITHCQVTEGALPHIASEGIQLRTLAPADQRGDHGPDAILPGPWKHDLGCWDLGWSWMIWVQYGPVERGFILSKLRAVKDVERCESISTQPKRDQCVWHPTHRHSCCPFFCLLDTPRRNLWPWDHRASLGWSPWHSRKGRKGYKCWLLQ